MTRRYYSQNQLAYAMLFLLGEAENNTMPLDVLYEKMTTLLNSFDEESLRIAEERGRNALNRKDVKQ